MLNGIRQQSLKKWGEILIYFVWLLLVSVEISKACLKSNLRDVYQFMIYKGLPDIRLHVKNIRPTI